MKARSSAFGALYASGVARVWASRRYQTTSYVVLAYHGISEQAHPLFTSKALFERHLRFFESWGGVAPVDELVQAEISPKNARLDAQNRIAPPLPSHSPAPTGGVGGRRPGEGAIPEEGETRPVCPRLRFVITFDDGYANVVRNAVPLLRKHALTATVYVNPGWIENATLPWWFQIHGSSERAKRLRCWLREMGFPPGSFEVNGDDADWPGDIIASVLTRIPQEQIHSWWRDVESEHPIVDRNLMAEFRLATWDELASARDVLSIGSHTYDHCILGLCRDSGFANHQIALAKQAIESRLGAACPHFAYPRGESGDYNEQTRQMLASAGHRTAMTCRESFALPDGDPLRIPRFYVGETPVAELAAQCLGVVSYWDTALHRIKSVIKGNKG